MANRRTLSFASVGALLRSRVSGPRRPFGLVALGFLLALLTLAPLAEAQSTGGSFGGGNFGGGGSGGSPPPSSGGSGGGGSWGGGGGSWGSPTPPPPPPPRRADGTGAGAGQSDGYRPSGPGATTPRPSGERMGTMGIVSIVCLTVFVGLFVIVMLVRGARMKLPTGQHPAGDGAGTGPSPAAIGRYAGPDAMYVHRLSLGIDWRSRAQVQATMKRLAETGDTSTPNGLATLLRESVLALRRSELGWLYIGQENLGSFRPQQAEQHFRQLATRMRASFQHEVVRSEGGATHTHDAPEMRAHSNEGEGTVVVHLIVVARRPLHMSTQPDANQIRSALDARSALTADQLVALEVVWSPAEENDRMSTAELEQNYPDMKLIDPTSIAGRIFCAYCRGPFAMELLSCPHCGAPAEDSRGNTSPR